MITLEFIPVEPDCLNDTQFAEDGKFGQDLECSTPQNQRASAGQVSNAASF